MQTFLPYPDLQKSAQVLDDRHLGKQRTECIQMLLALWYPTRKNYEALWEMMGYKTCDPIKKTRAPYLNHPCTKMWEGYEEGLRAFLVSCVQEWGARGFDNTRCATFLEVCAQSGPVVYPPWFGDPKFHAQHRAALLAKKPQWYNQWGWAEDPEVAYTWGV